MTAAMVLLLLGGAGCSRTPVFGPGGLGCAKVEAGGGWKNYFREQSRRPQTPVAMAQLRLAARLMWRYEWEAAWSSDPELVKRAEPVFSVVVGRGGEIFDAVTMWAGDNPNAYLFRPGTTTLGPVAGQDENCIDQGHDEWLPFLTPPNGRVQLLELQGVDRDGTRLGLGLSVLVDGDTLTSSTFSAVIRRGNQPGFSLRTFGLGVTEKDGVLRKAESTVSPMPPLPSDHWSITIDFGKGTGRRHGWDRDVVDPPNGQVRLTLRRGVTDSQGVVLTPTAPLPFSRVNLHLDPATLPPGL